MSFEGNIKEQMALFDKSGSQSLQCHGLSDSGIIGLGGWEGVRLYMD